MGYLRKAYWINATATRMNKNAIYKFFYFMDSKRIRNGTLKSKSQKKNHIMNKL
jgi:hypothetical protein